MALIELRGINKTYEMGGEPLRALRDIDLDINEGEYISIMGPSGSGKSTLLNMLGLLDRPDSGSYQLDNRATEGLDEEKEQHCGVTISVLSFSHFTWLIG